MTRFGVNLGPEFCIKKYAKWNNLGVLNTIMHASEIAIKFMNKQRGVVFIQAPEVMDDQAFMYSNKRRHKSELLQRMDLTKQRAPS